MSGNGGAGLTADLVVIGGGVVGLALADAWLTRNPGDSVIVYDKEDELAAHASGRNSGVLHAGFYYAPDSLKARLTRDGNRMLKEFCAERGVPVRATGKVVVTTNEEQLSSLMTLLERGQANGVELELIDEAGLSELEPLALVKPDYARTFNGSPTGGGRITERTARPALRELHPHLAHIHQPLAGEYAIRREVARHVPFEIDYGVEIGLLIDIASKYGTEAIAEVAIPPRVHRNRPESELAEPTRQVLRTARSRAGLADQHTRPPLASIEHAIAYA